MLRSPQSRYLLTTFSTAGLRTNNSQHGDHIIHGSATDYVAYQDGAIVSKEIVKYAAGTVTIFALARARG